MEKKILNGYGFCWGNKMLLHNTEITRKNTKLYNAFIDKMCEMRGVEDKVSQYTENNYKTLKFGLTKVEVYDCGSYYSVRFENGQANYPKTDCNELVFF